MGQDLKCAVLVSASRSLGLSDGVELDGGDGRLELWGDTGASPLAPVLPSQHRILSSRLVPKPKCGCVCSDPKQTTSASLRFRHFENQAR